jgi:hypothetical protein
VFTSNKPLCPIIKRGPTNPLLRSVPLKPGKNQTLAGRLVGQLTPGFRIDILFGRQNTADAMSDFGRKE